MFSLIYKDMIILKKYFLIWMPFIIVLIFMGSSKESIQAIYVIFTIFLITYFNIYYGSGKDERNKSEVILNSFPIKRSTMVIQKYMNVLLISFFVWFLELIISSIFGVANVGDYRFYVKVEYLIISVLFLNIYFALYYPWYFKFGSFKLRNFNKFSSIIVILLPTLINRFRGTYIIQLLNKVFINLIQSNNIIYILFLFSIVLFLLSMILSIKVYLNKEL